MGVNNGISVELKVTMASRGGHAQRPREAPQLRRYQMDSGAGGQGEAQVEAAAAAAVSVQATRRQPVRQARRKRPYGTSDDFEWSNSSGSDSEDDESPRRRKVKRANHGSRGGGQRVVTTPADVRVPPPPLPYSPPEYVPESTSNPRERLLMRDWLVKQLDNKTMGSVLCWEEDTNKTRFRMAWVHGSRQQWRREYARLFEEWAKHTGKFDVRHPDTKRWKANFRCALNSLQDVKEEKSLSRKRGEDAFKIYTLLPSKRTHSRRGGAESSRTKAKPSSSVSVASPGDKVMLPLYDSWKASSNNDALCTSVPSPQGAAALNTKLAPSVTMAPNTSSSGGEGGIYFDWNETNYDMTPPSPLTPPTDLGSSPAQPHHDSPIDSHSRDHVYAKTYQNYGLIPEVVETEDALDLRQLVWEQSSESPTNNIIYTLDGTDGGSSPSNISDTTDSSVPSDAEITALIVDMMDHPETNYIENCITKSNPTPFMTPPYTSQTSRGCEMVWDTDVLQTHQPLMMELGLENL